MATVFNTRDKGPEIVRKLNSFAGELEEGMGDLTQAVEDAQQSASDAEQSKIETEGFRDETAQYKSDFESAFGGLSYLSPVEYDAGINIDSAVKTVEYDGEVYAPLPSEVPFTTSGTFEADKFRLIQGVTTQQMASTAAGGFAANIGRNVIAVDSIADLLALPAGARRGDLRYLVKGYHAGSDVGGGEFYWDAASTDADNGGTVFEVSGVATGRFVRRFDGAASIQYFGAVPDGVTDYSDQILAACLYGITNDIAVYVPSGVYRVTYNKILLNFSNSSKRRFVLFGDGATSVLKMLDGVVNGTFRRMFDISPSVDMELIEVRDILLDNNARASDPPETPFAFEQSHTLRLAAPSGVTVKMVRYQNVGIKDPVADGINNQSSPTAVIENFIISNCYEIDRTRRRSSIQLSRLPVKTVITGFRGKVIEAEVLTSATDSRELIISNTIVDDLDLGVGDSGINDTATVSISNVIAKNSVQLHSGVFKVSNSVFRLVGDGRWNRLGLGSKVTGTTIIVRYDAETESTIPFWPFRSEGYKVGIEFDDCDFVIDSDDPDLVVSGGSLVHPNTALSVAQYNNGDRMRLVIRNSRFDPRSYRNVVATRCGDVLLENNIYGGQVGIFQGIVSAGWYNNLVVHGGDFYAVTGAAIAVQPLSSLIIDQETTISHIVLEGDWRGVKNPVERFGGSGIANTNPELTNNRRMLMAELPTKALLGDIIQLKTPVFGSPDVYRVTTSSETDPTFAMVSQAGVARGTTGNRPTLTEDDTGCQYIDTTLSAAGVPIWWTGTAWVDATGAVV